MSHKRTFILKRLALTLLSVYVIATVVFLAFRLVPGDPATALVDPRLSPEARRLVLQRHGLDRPLYEQYVVYLRNLVVLDLGVSFARGEAVGPLVVDRMVNTLSLTLTSLVLAYVVGPVLGAYLAWNRGTPVDTAGIAVVTTLRGAPVFWTGMLGLVVFSFWLGWLPTGGMGPDQYAPSLYRRFVSVEFLRHLLLPLSVTTLYLLSVPTLVLRSNVVEVLDADFIQFCRAQGLSRASIVYRHAARNALLPVLHYAAIYSAFAVGGSVVIETVFSWPGLGRLMWDAVLTRDYPIVQAAFLAIAVVVVTMNWVADVVSAFVDPRAVAGER